MLPIVTNKAISADLAASSETVHSANPLNNIEKTLTEKLKHKGLPQRSSLPPIQDRYARLFFIPTAQKTTPASQQVRNYVNTLLAAKEHVNQMPNGVESKKVLSDLIGRHEALFGTLNHIAVSDHFSAVGNTFEQQLGSDLLSKAAKDGMRDFLQGAMVIRNDYKQIGQIKKDREGEFEITPQNLLNNQGTPSHIMPPTSLMAFFEIIAENKPEDKLTQFIENVLKKIMVLGSELVEKTDNSDKMLKIGLLTAVSELPKALQENPELSLMLSQVSYELAREAPYEMLRQRQGDVHILQDVLINTNENLNRLEKVLTQSGSLSKERSETLDAFNDKLSLETHAELTVDNYAENVASVLAQMRAQGHVSKEIEDTIFDVVTHDLGQSSTQSTKKSKKKKSKKSHQASHSQQKTVVDNQKKQRKIESVFTSMKQFIQIASPEPPFIPPTSRKVYQELSQYWTQGTFESISGSLSYHQRKHAPEDDMLSYMKQAKEFLAAELNDYPPNAMELKKGKLRRHSPNGDFMIALKDSHQQWKIATFHSHRYTSPGEEKDSLPKLKEGQHPSQFSMEKVVQSAIENRLRNVTIGSSSTQQ